MPDEIPDSAADVAEIPVVPVWTPHVAGWVYPVGVAVVRHLKMEGVKFEKVLHSYTPIDETKYNIADDSARKNPTLLEVEMCRSLEADIHEFKKKFIEFKNAEFDILFVYQDNVRAGW